MEHYVTIFDSRFVLCGMALHESLLAHCQPFTLWVVALDAAVGEQLSRLKLPSVQIIQLEEVENEALRSIKSGRTAGEYCWTLTPFLPRAVMKRAADATRVTYLDADLYFFAPPKAIFDELEVSGKKVLITEHGYAPNYDRTLLSGRFCVQFIVFSADARSAAVLAWWQKKCLEWCFARHEDGKFGDQKYLDVWPEIFGDCVHVLKQWGCTLAPWNVDARIDLDGRGMVFYHFQGFRILSPTRVKLYHGYRVSSRSRWVYRQYAQSIETAARTLVEAGYVVPVMPEHTQKFKAFKYFIMTQMSC